MSDIFEKAMKELPNGETISQYVDLIRQGASVGDLLGVDSEKLEILYALAYSLYNSEKYADAEKIFRALCVYDGTVPKFWLGLGGCVENLKRFDEAAQIYALGSVMSGLQDPEPMFFAAICFLKGGKKAEAIETLEYIEIMGREGNAHDLEFKERSKALVETLKKQG